jgi:hypothetical protein
MLAFTAKRTIKQLIVIFAVFVITHKLDSHKHPEMMFFTFD